MLLLRQADVKLVETARFSSCEFSDRNFIYHKHSILRPKKLYLRSLPRKNNPNPLKRKECSIFTDTGTTAPELSFGGPQDRLTEVSLTGDCFKFETGTEKHN